MALWYHSRIDLDGTLVPCALLWRLRQDFRWRVLAIVGIQVRKKSPALEPIQKTSRSRRQKRTVIIVDDDPSMCRALALQLEMLGFNVMTFQSAENLLAGDRPRRNVCILADVYLPGMSGAELCVHLAAARPAPPVILMTGRPDERTLRLMREAHPIASMFKPFDQISLLRATWKAFARAGKTHA